MLLINNFVGFIKNITFQSLKEEKNQLSLKYTRSTKTLLKNL